MSLPSLARLPHSPISVDYEDDLDKVVGGCKPGSKDGTDCYDTWMNNLTMRVLENPRANTIILISVGHGVLELRALRTLLLLRNEEDGVFIGNIILIDPYTPEDVAEEAEREFSDKLPDVNVKYYTGPSSYDHALKQLLEDKNMLVAAIGALNFGTLASDNKRERNLINTLIAMVVVAAQRLSKVTDGSMHVVQAFQNDGKYYQRDESAYAFKERMDQILMQMLNWHMRRWNMN